MPLQSGMLLLLCSPSAFDMPLQSIMLLLLLLLHGPLNPPDRSAKRGSMSKCSSLPSSRSCCGAKMTALRPPKYLLQKACKGACVALCWYDSCDGVHAERDHVPPLQM